MYYKLAAKHLVSKLALTVICISASSAMALQQMSDEDLSSIDAQALIGMSYISPTDTTNLESKRPGGATNIGFYKIGMEAEIELNANIRRLQLGCGGRNGAGECDIDMENVSLSGPPDGKLTSTTDATINGTPTWSKGRANTSAKLTNPFIEFAIANPTQAAMREVVGFRLSAEEILGYLSAGTVNDRDPITQKSTGGGINTFSGYIQVAPTPVNGFTEPSIFGVTEDQQIAANVNLKWFIVDIKTAAITNVNKMTPGRNGYVDVASDSNLNSSAYLCPASVCGTQKRIWGINVPSVKVGFEFPRTAVTGNRMSQLNLVVRDVPIPRIAISAQDGVLGLSLIEDALGLVGEATFFMGAKGTTQASCQTYNTTNCSYISNLKANVTVKENFNLVHNLPVTSGGYLSLQKQAMRWPGSSSAFIYTPSTGAYQNVADNHTVLDTQVFNAGDISQPGWWLSFADPLDFGALNPTAGIPMQDVLPQISSFITDNLSQTNIMVTSLGDILGAVFGAPLYKSVGNIQLANNARAVMTLENLLMDSHQKPIPNCWGTLKFC